MAGLDRVEQSGIKDPVGGLGCTISSLHTGRVWDHLVTGHDKGVNNSGIQLSVCFPSCMCKLWTISRPCKPIANPADA